MINVYGSELMWKNREFLENVQLFRFKCKTDRPYLKNISRTIYKFYVLTVNNIGLVLRVAAIGTNSSRLPKPRKGNLVGLALPTHRNPRVLNRAQIGLDGETDDRQRERHPFISGTRRGETLRVSFVFFTKRYDIALVNVHCFPGLLYCVFNRKFIIKFGRCLCICVRGKQVVFFWWT